MKKVILILVDGMRADCALEENSRTLNEVKKMGASTVCAKTIFPSITLPCHMSLFHSVPPERHGIMGNSYKEFNHPVKGLIEVLHNAGKSSEIYYSWEEVRDIWRPAEGMSYTTFYSWEELHEKINVDTALTDEFLAKYKNHDCDFTFLYLGDTDEVGHIYGWMSKEYLECVENAAQNIKRVLQAVSEDYAVIITADHGGHDRHHGDDIPEDMTIPVILIGDGFEENSHIDAPVSILDIAPTIAGILGVSPDKDWEGRSLL